MPFQNEDKLNKEPVKFSDLYPDLTPEQKAETDFYIKRYIEVVRRIFLRVEAERKEKQKLIEIDE